MQTGALCRADDNLLMLGIQGKSVSTPSKGGLVQWLVFDEFLCSVAVCKEVNTLTQRAGITKINPLEEVVFDSRHVDLPSREQKQFDELPVDGAGCLARLSEGQGQTKHGTAKNWPGPSRAGQVLGLSAKRQKKTCQGKASQKVQAKESQTAAVSGR